MHGYACEFPEALVQAVQAVAQAAQTLLDDLVRLAMAAKIAAARTAQYGPAGAYVVMPCIA